MEMRSDWTFAPENRRALCLSSGKFLLHTKAQYMHSYPRPGSRCWESLLQHPDSASCETRCHLGALQRARRCRVPQVHEYTRGGWVKGWAALGSYQQLSVSFVIPLRGVIFLIKPWYEEQMRRGKEATLG